MIVGLFLLFTQLGTLQIQPLMARAAAAWPQGSALRVAAALLLLGGAVGKSAQLPLQTWLPDAMAGPSPVSALIHAATMVTAGVYLIARTNVLFDLAPAARTTVAVIGAATLLYAGVSALFQVDLKRILAYSTISQVGYMFLALGVGAWSAGVFMFITHAFFKALLFLSAGVVIEAHGRRARHLQDGRPAHASAVRLLDVPHRRRGPCRPAHRDRRASTARTSSSTAPCSRPRAASGCGSPASWARCSPASTPSAPSSSCSSARCAPNRGPVFAPASRCACRFTCWPSSPSPAASSTFPAAGPTCRSSTTSWRPCCRPRRCATAASPAPCGRPSCRASSPWPASASPGCSTSAAASRRPRPTPRPPRATSWAAGASTGSTATPSRCRSCGSPTPAATTSSSRPSTPSRRLTRAGWRGLVATQNGLVRSYVFVIGLGVLVGVLLVVLR